MTSVRRTSLLALALLAGTASSAFAADIRQISFAGLERVEEATVRYYLGTNVRNAYTTAKLIHARRDWYGTGLFADVEMSWNGSKLAVELQESPLVNRVVFEGNDKL